MAGQAEQRFSSTKQAGIVDIAPKGRLAKDIAPGFRQQSKVVTNRLLPCSSPPPIHQFMFASRQRTAAVLAQPAPPRQGDRNLLCALDRSGAQWPRPPCPKVLMRLYCECVPTRNMWRPRALKVWWCAATRISFSFLSFLLPVGALPNWIHSASTNIGAISKCFTALLLGWLPTRACLIGA